MTFFRFINGLVLAGLLAGCSSVPRIVTEYRIDVQQGNVVTQEMISNLRPGLTRDQVRFVMGTPMLTDLFHADRWDYLYRIQKGRTNEVLTRRLSVYFDKEGKLSSVTGDVEAADRAELGQPVAKMQVIELTEKNHAVVEEKGWVDRMKEKVGF